MPAPYYVIVEGERGPRRGQRKGLESVDDALAFADQLIRAKCWLRKRIFIVETVQVIPADVPKPPKRQSAERSHPSRYVKRAPGDSKQLRREAKILQARSQVLREISGENIARAERIAERSSAIGANAGPTPGRPKPITITYKRKRIFDPTSQ